MLLPSTGPLEGRRESATRIRGRTQRLGYAHGVTRSYRNIGMMLRSIQLYGMLESALLLRSRPCSVRSSELIINPYRPLQITALLAQITTVGLPPMHRTYPHSGLVQVL